MLQLSADGNFHFELLRILSGARGLGADIGEVLNVAEKITPGDYESWYENLTELAEWVESTIDEKNDDRVSLRDAFWRASRYHFAAGFFFQQADEDPRANNIWKRWLNLFNKGCRMLEHPPVWHTVQADGFEVPIILFRPSRDASPRPTLIIGNGLDGSMEEMIHMQGLQALERGYNVVLYEGPGQPSVRRTQNIGFIYDWERAVSPIIDYLVTQPFVQRSQISLLGNSLGGYLAARAAAKDDRIAAVILIDGLYDLHSGVGKLLGPEAMACDEKGDAEGFEMACERAMSKSRNLNWLMNQFCWAFIATRYEVMQKLKKMTLKGIEDQITCPTFIAGAENDLFDETDQPGRTRAALGENAYLKRFTAREAADAHCHVGAVAFCNQVIFGWLEKALSNKW